MLILYKSIVYAPGCDLSVYYAYVAANTQQYKKYIVKMQQLCYNKIT